MAQRNVIKADFAFQEVFKFEPQKLAAANIQVIDDYIRTTEMNKDFQIADIVSNFTGLADLEAQRMESEIEQKALEGLKTIQEQAYSEAFELGMAEGRRQALIEATEEIDRRLQELDLLVDSLRDSKQHFLNNNENQLMKMVYFLATEVALQEITQKPNDVVLSILRSSVNVSHSEEMVKVTVAPEQIDFLESLQKEKKRDFDFLKKVEFSPQEGIHPGGCIITTNYSEVDARVEERITKLWEEIQDSIPPLKDRITHE